MDNKLSLKDRLKKNFKENKVLLFVFLAIWILTVVLTLNHYKTTLGKQSVGNEGSQNVVELTSDVVIKERITIDEINSSKNFGIKFATYARNNNGNVFIKVNGCNTRKEYVNATIPTSEINDNDFCLFELSGVLNSEKEKDIEITISSDGNVGESIGVYYSNGKAFNRSSLMINEETMSGDLSLRFLLEDADLYNFYKIVITWIIVTFTFVILLILLINPKLEVVFTALAIVFGLTFLIIITPMSVPDETAHYEYSFQLSNMIMGEKDYRYFDNEYQNYGSFAGHYNISAAYIRLVNKINKPLSLDGFKVEMNNNIKDSYTTPFIPQALGLTVARLLKLNMLKTFYLGRLFNLTFYVFCIYIAIKKTPIHKLLFGTLATLPIFLQQAASFSYDCFINGLTLVVLACALKWMYQDEKINIGEFVFVFIVNLLVAPIKVVYGLFSLLYWFVPAKNYGSKKNKIIGTLIITGPAMYELIVLMFPLVFRAVRKMFEKLTDSVNVFKFNSVFADEGENAYNYAEAINEDELYTFSDVINNPLGALEIFARTIRYFIKPWFYGAFGRTLSGNTLVLPINLVHAMLVLLITMTFREEPYVESIGFKVISVSLCVLAGLMMLGGMLISWTTVNQKVIEDFGGPVIQGMQGRYFSPLLPYFFIIFNNKKIKIPQKLDKYFIFTFMLLVFEVMVYVLSYTFVN